MAMIQHQFGQKSEGAGLDNDVQVGRKFISVFRGENINVHKILAWTALACVPFLSGCSTYLHSASFEAQTAQVKTNFSALKTPAFLEAETAREIDFATREDAAVASLATSARNVALVAYIRPGPLASTTSDSAQKLLAQADADLSILYAAKPPGADWPQADLDMLGDASRQAANWAQLMAAASSDIAATKAGFDAIKKDDKRPTDCLHVPPPPAAPPAGASDVDNAYFRLQVACAITGAA